MRETECISGGIRYVQSTSPQTATKYVGAGGTRYVSSVPTGGARYVGPVGEVRTVESPTRTIEYVSGGTRRIVNAGSYDSGSSRVVSGYGGGTVQRIVSPTRTTEYVSAVSGEIPSEETTLTAKEDKQVPVYVIKTEVVDLQSLEVSGERELPQIMEVEVPQVRRKQETKIRERIVEKIVEQDVQIDEEEVVEIPVDLVTQKPMEMCVDVPQVTVVQKEVEVPVIQSQDKHITIPKVNKIKQHTQVEIPILPVELNQEVVINKIIKRRRPMICEERMIVEKKVEIEVPCIHKKEEPVDVYNDVEVEVPVVVKEVRHEKVFIEKVVDVPVFTIVEVPVEKVVEAYTQVPQIQVTEIPVEVVMEDDVRNGTTTYEKVHREVRKIVGETEIIHEVEIGADLPPIYVDIVPAPQKADVGSIEIIEEEIIGESLPPWNIGVLTEEKLQELENEKINIQKRDEKKIQMNRSEAENMRKQFVMAGNKMSGEKQSFFN